uniref:Cation/H+ exchanger transmembrane domain-containing protein n=1 Tax=Alexandrium monilatum TaxID=311494 RepID=A0A7S4SWC8_9DINO
MASKFSRLLGVSSIVLEIATGVVMGPRAVGLIAEEYATCEHARHTECMPPANAKEMAERGEYLGDHLEKFNRPQYCDLHLFAAGSHRGSGPLGHSEGGHDAGHSGNAADSGAPYAGHGSGNSHSDSSGNHDVAGSQEASGGHDSGDSHEASGDHTQSTHPTGSDPGQNTMIQGPDNGRLLSGGGGGGSQYSTFEECLEKQCEAEVSHDCGLTPDVFTLIGHAGVALMIFESGMHFDFEKAKTVGLPACCVAVLGTILPLIFGSVLMVIFGRPFFPHGISAGTALAPTSVGIALRLLGEAGVLQHDFGQAIITAAFVDDILSLVLFNILFSLGGDFDMFKTVWAPIIGISFMLIAMYGAVHFWPKVIDGMIMPQAPERRDGTQTGVRRFQLERDELLFLLQIILLVAYSMITHLLGTHLWGCFIAGMSFACLSPPHHAHHVWVKQTKRMTTWMIRIFFSCTVAFSIPVMKLLSISAFWKGSILGIVACVLTKVCCAPFMGPPRWVIGWAMVGRAEFAYLIAQMALAGNMLDEESFSIVIWALLYATVFAPFVFRYLLNQYVKAQGLQGNAGDAHALTEEAKGTKLEFATAPEQGLHPNDIDIGCMKAAPVLPIASAGKQGQGNGFLCCLFFKKVIVQ